MAQTGRDAGLLLLPEIFWQEYELALGMFQGFSQPAFEQNSMRALDRLKNFLEELKTFLRGSLKDLDDEVQRRGNANSKHLMETRYRVLLALEKFENVHKAFEAIQRKRVIFPEEYLTWIQTFNTAMTESFGPNPRRPII